MKKKQKILFIIWSFSYGGGAENLLANIVNRMDLDKYEIDILEYWHSNIKILEVDKRIHVLKPIIDETKDNHLKMWLAKILVEYFPGILRKIYLKNNYDYEIAFNSLIPTYLLSKKGKTISWVHTDIYDLKTHKYEYWLQKRAYKHIKKIVAISDNTYQSIIDIYPEHKDKTVIIHNSLDFDTIKKMAKEKPNIKKEKFTFLFAGRLDDRKNPLYLIDIAQAMKEKGLDFNIWMLGRGKLKDELSAKIKKLHLEEEVKLLGFQENQYAYLAQSDAVIMTSTQEGFPAILAEGLVLGKPFISTPVGGTKEMAVDHKCGFRAENITEFVNWADKLINDPKLYRQIAANGQKYIAKFTYQQQIKDLEKLFATLDKEEKNN